MKNYHYLDSAKKLNRKRLAVAAIIIAWFLFLEPFSKESDWFLRATAQMIPLLAFETQYGNPSVDYAAGYEVPDWFFEDVTFDPAYHNSTLSAMNLEKS